MAIAKINFTKNALLALPGTSKGKRLTYYDARMRGLHVQVTSNGVKTFYVRRKVSGRSERFLIGRFPDLTIEQARAKAASIHASLAIGDNPAEARRKLKGEMTLGQLFDEYESRYLIPKQKKSADELRCNYERYLGELSPSPRNKHGRERKKPTGSVNWHRRKLSSVSREDVRRLHTKIGVSIGRTTANRVLQLLRAMYNHAIRWNLLSRSNPAEGIEMFVSRSRDRFLQVDELPRLLTAVEASQSENLRDLVLMALFTGARKGNLLSMKWSDVNLQAFTWRIPDTKNGQPQLIPLVPEAIALLERRHLMRSNDYVFAGTGKRQHMISPKRSWDTVRKRAGLTNFRFHDLRRTLGSWQAGTGASLAVIGHTLGHKDLKSTAIYARVAVDPIRQSIERATQAMLSTALTRTSLPATPTASS
jgi:integrase